jgi:uncharacterized membrane protein
MIDLVGVIACSFFAGASIYISLVEHPARMSCSTEVAATQWAPSYKRATVMQVTLAVLATVAGVVRWWQGAGGTWLAGSLLILSVIPYTAIVVLPTNKKLLAPNRDLRSGETRELLEQWGRLHAVRSVVSFVASVLFIWASQLSSLTAIEKLP